FLVLEVNRTEKLEHALGIARLVVAIRLELQPDLRRRFGLIEFGAAGDGAEVLHALEEPSLGNVLGKSLADNIERGVGTNEALLGDKPTGPLAGRAVRHVLVHERAFGVG